MQLTERLRMSSPRQLDYRWLFRKVALHPLAVPTARRVIGGVEHLLRVLRNNVSDPATNGEYWLVSSLCAPRTVLDVGYNQGEFTAQVLSVHREARVHAFDPCRDAAVRHRARHGSDGRVVFHSFALGDSPG